MKSITKAMLGRLLNLPPISTPPPTPVWGFCPFGRVRFCEVWLIVHMLQMQSKGSHPIPVLQPPLIFLGMRDRVSFLLRIHRCEGGVKVLSRHYCVFAMACAVMPSMYVRAAITAAQDVSLLLLLVLSVLLSKKKDRKSSVKEKSEDP
eukprot:RCo017348